MNKASRNIRLLMLFGLFSDLRLYTPILVVYFHQLTGSMTLASLVIALPYVSSAMAEVPTGMMSDRIGRNHTMVAGALCSTFAVTLYAWGPTTAVLVAGAFAEGVSRAFYSGNNDAFLYEVAESERVEFAHHWGRVNSMVQIASAIAAVVGSVVAEQSMHLVLWLSVAPQVACIAIAVMMRPPTRSRPAVDARARFSDVVAAFRKSPKLRKLAIAGAVDWGIGNAEWRLRPAFIVTVWPLWAAGLSNLIGTGGASLSYWYGGRLAKRLGYENSLAGYAVLHRGLSIFSFAMPTAASPALIASTGLGMGVNDVAEAKLLHDEFTDDQRATMASLISLLGSLVFAAAALIIGVAADAWGIAKALLLAEFVLLVPTCIYLQLVRSAGRERQSPKI